MAFDGRSQSGLAKRGVHRTLLGVRPESPAAQVGGFPRGWASSQCVTIRTCT
jgi:hypothetical protein